MDRRRFIAMLAATAGCMSLGVRDVAAATPRVTSTAAAGKTYREDWANLDNWNIENPGNCHVDRGQLIVEGNTVLHHKTLVFRRDQPMAVSGWLQSNDLQSKAPTYCGAVLQSIANGNYYGSVAIGNWVDEANGIFDPYWIIFCNEYRMSSQWYANGKRLVNPSQPQPYSLAWAPSVPDGSRGAWRMKLNGRQGSSPKLPLASDCYPSLGFGRGRAVVGPLTMVGTPRR